MKTGKYEDKTIKTSCHYSRLFLILLLLLLAVTFVFGQVNYVGTNLACGEFGGDLPGTYNRTYTYPTHSQVDYYTGKGMNVFRVPFKWERLQFNAFDDLNWEDVYRLEDFIDYAASKGAYTILDPHNYARYYGEIIGSDDLSVDTFKDFWARLADYFKDNPYVIFGLMNEPHGMETELWLSDANAAIDAIRETGASNLILVPGNAYTGAHSWNSNWYGTPNAEVMLGIVDPLDNYAFEVHQYMDNNSSGTSESCVSTSVGSERLQNFTKWAREHNLRGFLGEFGSSDNETCLQALDDMLQYIDDNDDVWLGWTYWAGGPWWGDYMFSIEPKNGQDKPQMAILEKHIRISSAQDKRELPVDAFILLENYPNPFNSNTSIKVSLPQNMDIDLSVFDLTGHKVDNIFHGAAIAGSHVYTWNSRNNATGIFLIRFSSDQFHDTIKCTLLK